MALTTVPASLSATALTLTTAAQPNITSVGTLTGLTVSGNIAHASDFTLDVGGSITLDSDSGVLDFDDGGTNIGRIENASSDFKLESRVQDKDIVLVGNDGGVGVEALRLDMSAAGAATFNGVVTASAGFVGPLTGNVTGTIQTAAQPNITSVGALTNVQVLNGGGSAGGTTPRIYSSASATLDISTNSARRLTIDGSGNVSILTSGVALNAPVLQVTNANVATYTGTTPAIHSPSSGTVAFSMAGAERMRIDSSGNIKLITANDTAGTAKFLTFGTNSYNRAGIKCTNAATYDGSLEFYTGNSSNFLERMRIDANGNLGIGINAPTKKLTVFGTGAGNATVQIEGEGGADPYINFLANNTQHWSVGIDDSDSDKFKISKHSALGTNDYFTINTAGATTLSSSGGSAGFLYLNYIRGISDGNTGVNIAGSDILELQTGGSARLKIDGSGHVSMNAPANLDVGGTASGIAFMTSNQIRVGGNDGTNMYTGYQLMLDRMNTPGDGPNLVLSRNGYFKGAIGGIQNASGNATSAEGALAFYTATTSAFNERMKLLHNNGLQITMGSQVGWKFRAYAWDSDSYFGVYDDNNHSANIKIDRSDGLTVFYVMGHTGNYHFYGSDTSDRDLKENIISIPDGSLSLVKQLKPCTFNFSAEGYGKDTRTGFIAQEVAEVFTTDNHVATGTDGNKDMGVDHMGIIAHLTKAIQELSAEVEALKAKVGE